MAVRLIRNSWWVDFRVDHIRYRKRSPENSRGGARAYESSLRKKLARGEAITSETRKTELWLFRDFAKKWFEDYVLPNNKTSEIATKRYALAGTLVPFFGQRPIGEIDAHDVERYKAALVRKGLSRKTINNRLTILRKCLQCAYEWLALKGSPPKIQWLKCPPPHTDYLSLEESELLLRHSSGVIGELILAALRTGMRQGELKGLQWSSIDWQNRTLVVRHSYCDLTRSLDTPKNNRERHIPIDLDLYEALNARRRETGYVFLGDIGEPFSRYQLRPALNAACRRAGIRKIGWHTLRHTFASHLAMMGTPLNVVQALLGHSSIEMTMRYAHVAPSALRTAIDLANPRAANAHNCGQPVGNTWRDAQLKQRSSRTRTSKDRETVSSNHDRSLPLAA